MCALWLERKEIVPFYVTKIVLKWRGEHRHSISRMGVIILFTIEFNYSGLIQHEMLKKPVTLICGGNNLQWLSLLAICAV